MMVFNMGVLYNDFPLLSYLKVLLPGVQVFYGFFDNVYHHDLSFSSYLLYKLSPSVFSQGFGLGWSLLGDFYSFAFGFIPLFIIYNYYWGKLIFNISKKFKTNIYFTGLFICFLTQLFMISRGSVSNLWALIIFYTIIYFLISLKSKK